MSDGSMLPPTATGLARAMDLLEERLFALPVQMISKDPATVDAALLDHLAWELSVDVWDLDWPEEVKRDVIAVSAGVHRFKGTPFAIQRALSAFDVDTELLEWFEPDGASAGMEPGSFRVTAYAGRSLYGDDENTINTRMIYAMNAVVQRAAPVSRKLEFRLGERFRSKVYLRSGTRPARLDQQEIDPKPRPANATSGPYLRAGSRAAQHSEIEHVPMPRPARARAETFLRQGARAVLVSAVFHDVERREA